MGKGLTVLAFGILGIAVLVTLVSMVRTGKPIRTFLWSLVQGISALGAVNLAAVMTGVSLGFSWLSVAGCAVFGIPGVISMLLMRCIAL